MRYEIFKVDGNINSKYLLEMICNIFPSFLLIRVPDINSKQGQNILEILQDCFEENSKASSRWTLMVGLDENINLSY